MNIDKFTIHTQQQDYTYFKERTWLVVPKETPDSVRFICWCILVSVIEKVLEQFDEHTKLIKTVVTVHLS